MGGEHLLAGSAQGKPEWWVINLLVSRHARTTVSIMPESCQSRARGTVSSMQFKPNAGGGGVGWWGGRAPCANQVAGDPPSPPGRSPGGLSFWWLLPGLASGALKDTLPPAHGNGSCRAERTGHLCKVACPLSGHHGPGNQQQLPGQEQVLVEAQVGLVEDPSNGGKRHAGCIRALGRGRGRCVPTCFRLPVP